MGPVLLFNIFSRKIACIWEQCVKETIRTLKRWSTKELRKLRKEEIYSWYFSQSIINSTRRRWTGRLRAWQPINMGTIAYTIQGDSKSSINFQKFVLQELLTLNPCHVYGLKINLSKFWYRLSEAAHHWGCGCCYLWHAATSVGRAVLSILHLPRHTWGSHRVLVRCENNFESFPFSLYIARRHMFNSTCKINFWKYILLFKLPCILAV
jgi:hypothetical protein